MIPLSHRAHRGRVSRPMNAIPTPPASAAAPATESAEGRRADGCSRSCRSSTTSTARHGSLPDGRWIGGFVDVLITSDTEHVLVDLKMGDSDPDEREVTAQLGLYRDMLQADIYGVQRASARGGPRATDAALLVLAGGRGHAVQR